MLIPHQKWRASYENVSKYIFSNTSNRTHLKEICIYHKSKKSNSIYMYTYTVSICFPIMFLLALKELFGAYVREDVFEMHSKSS